MKPEIIDLSGNNNGIKCLKDKELEGATRSDEIS